jgi:hypothetical protein
MTRPSSLKQGPIPVIVGFPDLSKAPDLDLAGNLDRMARAVAELMAAPVDLDLSPPTDATKAAPEPDAKPSCRR